MRLREQPRHKDYTTEEEEEHRFIRLVEAYRSIWRKYKGT